MLQPDASPAWASVAIGRLLAGSWRTASVIACMEIASYITVPMPDSPAQLMALLSPAAIRLPLGVCVSGGRLPDVGAEVRVGHGLVDVPGRTWRPVRWWDPRPHVDSDALVHHGRALLGVVRDEPASSFGHPLPEALAVAGALAAGDAAAAFDVIGLGPGLTPAGDDVVAGALAVLALVGRLDDSVRDAIAARARTHTAALSAALLEAAGKGQMIPQAARLLTTLAAGEPDEHVVSAAGALFRIGSTSGHDLCAGMAGALAVLS
jgi:hypothetical protein